MPRVGPTCLITDRHAVGDAEALLVCLEAACRGGIGMLQVREKDLDAGELLALCRSIREMALPFGIPVLVNGRVDVALAAGLDGVHLSLETGLPVADARRLLGENALIGVSAHRIEELEPAARDGADFALFGPVYDTPSKRRYGPPQGLERLQNAAAVSPIPVLALGGIDYGRLEEVQAAGAAGAAAIRALLCAADIEREVRRWGTVWR